MFGLIKQPWRILNSEGDIDSYAESARTSDLEYLLISAMPALNPTLESGVTWGLPREFGGPNLIHYRETRETWEMENVFATSFLTSGSDLKVADPLPLSCLTSPCSMKELFLLSGVETSGTYPPL